MPVVQQALRTANESVNEGVSVYDERIVNKGKGIIIMIDDNGKKYLQYSKIKKMLISLIETNLLMSKNF